MPLPLQKYLGWLSRYLYAIENGPIQVPMPVIDVANEPFGWRDIRESIVSVVGNATLDFTTPEGRRRLYCWAFISGAPAFSAGDDVQLSILRDGLTYPLIQFDNLVAAREELNRLPLIRSRTDESGVAGFSGVGYPVMVGPGESLRLIVGSAAGGTTGTFRGLAIDVPAFAPFPNVF